MKTKVTLERYLETTKRPRDKFKQNDEYIIFQHGPLSITFDKNAYCKTVNQKGSLRLSEEILPFDIMNCRYRLPHLPKDSDIGVMFGQYFMTLEGPCFYLTEPKMATHVLISNMPKYPDYYRIDNVNPKYNREGYSDCECQVITLDSLFDWIGKIIYIAKPAAWEKESYIKKCQLSFFKQLDDFYCA